MLGLVVAVAMVCGLYWVAMPKRARASMPLVPGAAVAVLLQLVVGLAYRLYLKTVGDGGAYQAGLASIGVTMIALYLFSFALLVGIEFNQMVAERQGPTVVRRWLHRLTARRHAHGGA